MDKLREKEIIRNIEKYYKQAPRVKANSCKGCSFVNMDEYCCMVECAIKQIIYVEKN